MKTQSLAVAMRRTLISLTVLLAAAAARGEVHLTGPIGERLDRLVRNHVMTTDVAMLTAPFREKTECRGWWQTEFWGKYTRGPIALARDTRFADGPLDEPWRSGCLDRAPAFTPARSPNDDIWMTFAAVVPVGDHHENPEGSLGRAVRFCDYASAADLWQPDNAARVWFPVEYWP